MKYLYTLPNFFIYAYSGGPTILERGPNDPPPIKNWSPWNKRGVIIFELPIPLMSILIFFSRHSAAQLSSLCGILYKYAGMPQYRSLDPSLYIT